MPDAGVWRGLWDAVHAANPTATLVSDYREGARTHATGALSYHARGMAIDIGGPNMMGYFEWIVANYPNSEEIIYSPAGARQIHNGQPHVYTGVTKADHYNHVHWATTSLAKASNGKVPDSGGTAPAEAPDTFTSILNFFVKPDIWVRVGMYLGGALLILLFVVIATGRKVSLPNGN
jgi:hypothetical protein